MIKFVHFVDRNVISQIKDQKLSKEDESLLRSLDRKDNRISPLKFARNHRSRSLVHPVSSGAKLGASLVFYNQKTPP